MRLFYALLGLMSIEASAQDYQKKGNESQEYSDSEVLSKGIHRVIVRMEQGCSISAWKRRNGPGCWYYADEQSDKRVKAVIAPPFTSDMQAEGSAWATWVGLPVFIEGGTEIVYSCPAGRFVYVGEVSVE